MSAVVFDGVHKRYRQYRDEAVLLRRLLQPRRAREFHELAALDDVSFSVDTGDTVGIIGRNGAGKTTLLRLLSGVSAPTAGTVRVQGPVAPLIGVGVGFNPELTGRENVRVNGRLLGMSPEEIDARYDAIVDFSEVGDFLDVPVKFYSSGMFLRLAFAVAVHTAPRVMAVDEILAVGDVGFQAKCFDRMRELQRTGMTIVIVTHNLQVLQRMAERTIVLDEGRIVHDGATEDAVRVFHEVMQRDAARRRTPTFLPDELGGAIRRDVADMTATIVDDAGAPTLLAHADRGLRVRVQATFRDDVRGPILGVALERPGLGLISAAGNDPDDYTEAHGPGRPLEAEVELSTPLLTGSYVLRTVIHDRAQHEPIGASPPVLFHVRSQAVGAGTVDVRPRFRIAGRDVGVARESLLEHRGDPEEPASDSDGENRLREDGEVGIPEP